MCSGVGMFRNVSLDFVKADSVRRDVRGDQPIGFLFYMVAVVMVLWCASTITNICMALDDRALKKIDLYFWFYLLVM